ncbi:MAG: DUF456 family protein [Planctomycetota bacterium]
MPVLVAQIVLPLVGLVCLALVLIGLPGTWLLLVLAGVAEWLTEPRLFSDATVVAALVLALLGEAFEFFFSAAKAKSAGASHRGALGALAGGIFGAILGTFLLPIPLVGSLLGGGLGAFTGATLLERHRGRTFQDARRIGRAAGVGHALGLLMKFVAGAAVWLLLTVTVIA